MSLTVEPGINVDDFIGQVLADGGPVLIEHSLLVVREGAAPEGDIAKTWVVQIVGKDWVEISLRDGQRGFQYYP